jgi:hypothetical protein
MENGEPAGAVEPAQHGVLGPDAEIGLIKQWIEANLGAVEHIERMARWRPSWNADVRVNGELQPIHVRGDRPGNWPPMPLSYECKVFELFGQSGVSTPRVHGWAFAACHPRCGGPLLSTWAAACGYIPGRIRWPPCWQRATSSRAAQW